MLKQNHSKHFSTRFSFRHFISRSRALAYRKKRFSFLAALPVLALFALFTLLSLKSFASGETSSLQLNYTGPVPSISFSSAHSRYGTNSANPSDLGDTGIQGDPGAWKVDKEAHYVGDNKAKITFNIQSRLKTNTQNKKDIVLALDNSNSVNGERLDRIRRDSANLVDNLLSDSSNRMALLKFNADASILTPFVPISSTANGAVPGAGNTYFSSDKNIVKNAISTIHSEGVIDGVGVMSYFTGLKKVEEILEGYQRQADRELSVIFVASDYPNKDTPSEVGQYKMLLSKYPYVNFIGIQYSSEDAIINPLKAVSQVQYHADMENLGEVLLRASIKPTVYTNFVLTDYLNSTKWQLDPNTPVYTEVNGVVMPAGNNKVSLTKETLNLPSPYGATPTDKITWDLSNLYKSGGTAKLEITVTFKDPSSIQENEIIPTNDHTSVTSSFTPDPNNPGDNPNPEDPNPTPDENVSTPNSPALKYKYKLSYLPNPPKVQAGSIEAEAGQTIGSDACTVDNMPNPVEEQHKVFETVLLAQTEPTCTNKTAGTKYLFRGWNINTYVKTLNKDYFIMPEKDFTISATWSRPEISKDMKGKIYKIPTLYDTVAKLTKGLDTNLDFSKMDLSISGVYTYDKSSPNHSNLILKSVAEGGPEEQYNGDYIDPQSPRFNPNYISHDLSGDSNGGNKDIYYFRGKVDNNNVLFANMCWKAVRTTSTGGTKLIYAGIPFNTVTNATYNGSRDSGVDPTKLKCTQDANNTPITGANATIGKSAFNIPRESPAYVGYMYGDGSYMYNSSSGAIAGTVYANDVSWDGTKYTLIDTYTIPAEGWLGTRPGASKMVHQEVAEKYHYTCNSNSTTCTRVRYTAYTGSDNYGNNYYLTLKNGKNIEQAKLDMYQNTRKSTIKTFIDKWYNGNSTNGLHAYEKLKVYADKLEDTVFCGDRTFASGLMKSKDDGLNVYNPKYTWSAHSAYGRNYKNSDINNDTVRPSLTCVNENDKFISRKLGNKLGLLTADEAVLAGSGGDGYSASSFLNAGASELLLSPGRWHGTQAGVFSISANGQLVDLPCDSPNYHARAAISVNSASLVVAGDGTIARPWLVQ